MNKYILDLLHIKLRSLLAATILFSVALYVIFGQTSSISFLIGFILSCLNFSILCISSNYLLTKQFRGTRYIYLAGFLLRYGALVLFVYELAKTKELNGFAFVAGMLSINFIIVASVFYRQLFKKAIKYF